MNDPIKEIIELNGETFLHADFCGSDGNAGGGGDDDRKLPVGQTSSVRRREESL